MPKNIIFCADGTWNDPNQDDNHDNLPDQTNVYKLFLSLAGELDPGTLRCADEQEKQHVENGSVSQIAKYIHGVGDSKNPVNRIMGGAFGAGVISRIVRGYTFISRNYQPGDKIYIVGFSRGAYTARALVGLICSQGLLAQNFTSDREQAYRYGAQAWYRYRRASIKGADFFARLAEVVADLPGFLTSRELDDGSFTHVDSIAAIGVWDTVGAMGIPDYDHGANDDSFRFADTTLCSRVNNGYHAVSLDEQREVFSPTLWSEADNVVQVLFPGAHADVGGGYPATGSESGLSDGALQWMIRKLTSAGMIFCSVGLQPDPAGVAHQPWKHLPWSLPMFPCLCRKFPAGMFVNSAVGGRMAASAVIADPGKAAAKYVPPNLPKNWRLEDH